MLLRSITRHVKQQNWFAVILDVIIVVVGVFIGIQVSNWNDNRLEQQLSAEFTERLLADITEEAWDFQYMIEYYRDVLDNVQRVLEDLEQGIGMPDEDLVVAAYRASQINIITRKRSTYDELVSIGKMDLIKDDLLRKTATGIYDFPFYDSIYTSGFYSSYREWFRMHIDSRVQLALSEHCGDKNVDPLDYQGILDSLDYPCNPQLPAELLSQAAQTIRTDARVLPNLRLRLVQLQGSLNSLEHYYPEITENLRHFKDVRRYRSKHLP